MHPLKASSRTAFDTLPQREAIHDLRNLFGIVASAKHVLERDPGRPQRIALLEAIEDAAMRGGQLTTDLLAMGGRSQKFEAIDVGARLADLAPMMNALGGSQIHSDLEVGCLGAFARIDADAFDATILELVANAAAADARMISIRAHKAGRRLWILVADDGRGMTPGTLAHARLGLDDGAAHGAGLSRVHHFVNASHGQFKIRSRPFGGTTMAITLPALLTVAVGAVQFPPRRGHAPIKKRFRRIQPHRRDVD